MEEEEESPITSVQAKLIEFWFEGCYEYTSQQKAQNQKSLGCKKILKQNVLWAFEIVFPNKTVLGEMKSRMSQHPFTSSHTTFLV